MLSEKNYFNFPIEDLNFPVRFESETFWLTLNQLSELFDRDKSVISRHLKNIFEEGELMKDSTVAFFATVATNGKVYQMEYFNLDAILSVGYRVNSKRGTRFRIWANEILREYIRRGYALDRKRMEADRQLISEIRGLLTDAEKLKEMISDEGTQAVNGLIFKYIKSFVRLNEFDTGTLELAPGKDEIFYEIKYEEARTAIENLKEQLVTVGQANDLFGRERDDHFQSILLHIIAHYFGQYVYATVEEQAANLLYLIIKDHPFFDGNKRIGAFLFIWFLERNKHLLYPGSNEIKINQNALTALALLIAQSDPKDKNLYVKLITQLIADE